MHAGLSYNLRNMKFMYQGGSLLEDDDDDGDSGVEIESPQPLPVQRKKLNVNHSFNAVYNLSSGRWAFQQFNPELECEMAENAKDNKEEDADTEEVLVDDVCMAELQSSLKETISRKFRVESKRVQRSKKKTVGQNGCTKTTAENDVITISLLLAWRWRCSSL
uniref:Uncharacterized protein n=1 Tax=Trichuris muris TaxID=70415 RepID=A0A5S6QAC8_TRIMR